MKFILVLLVIGVAGFLYYLYKKNFKSISCNAISMFTGAPKTGKSTLAFYTCYRDYKRYLFGVRIRNFFNKLFHLELEQEGAIYSNIPLSIKEGYIPLTKDLILGNYRFIPNSYVFIDEASLFADSMSFKKMSELTSEQIMMFNKLAGHRSLRVYYNSQVINDTHYSIKRCLSEDYYIMRTIKLPIIPFAIAYVREERYSDDQGIMNVYDSDAEDTMKKVLFNYKKVWSCFDYKCYSDLGGYQDKPLSDKKVFIKKGSVLKADNIVSFREFRSFKNES